MARAIPADRRIRGVAAGRGNALSLGRLTWHCCQVSFSLEKTPFGDPLAQALCEEVQDEYRRRYKGDGDQTPIDHGEFTPPNGAFLVAFNGEGEPVGCGGWRAHGDEDAEMKRVYVRPTARRQGLARLIVAELEASAAASGRKRLVLETGNEQPEAIALYEELGYRPVEPFGYYACTPGSLHLGKDLGTEH
jgi:GNAT superfamily N-acetyltransferase